MYEGREDADETDDDALAPPAARRAVGAGGGKGGRVEWKRRLVADQSGQREPARP